MRLLLIGFYLVGHGVNCDLAFSQTYDDELEGALGEYASDLDNSASIPLPPIYFDNPSPIQKTLDGVSRDSYLQRQYQHQQDTFDAQKEYIRNLSNIQGRKARGYYDE